MHITFYGAAREVTGSMHLITTEKDRILLDCGMFQGRREESQGRNKIFPFNPGLITNLVLSHAHIDHSGRVPLLTKKDFKGRILCTRPTMDACKYLLADSARIQVSDANYLNYKTLRAALLRALNSGKKRASMANKIKKVLKTGRHDLNIKTINRLMKKYQLEYVKPSYNEEDADSAMTYFEGHPYKSSIQIGKNVECTLYDAGHILGSAISIITIKENGKKYNICYTGDLGRYGSPVIKDPESNFAPEHRDIDLLIIESTYGNREHGPTDQMSPMINQVVQNTFEKGGTVVIPSFAFGRTQELLYILHKLYDKGDIKDIKIYVDSPLASNITKVFGEHPEVYSKDAHKDFLEHGENPFYFPLVKFVDSVDESIELVKDNSPHIVISASGMCEGGRILHHLRYKIHDPKNTILIVGYMAQNTLGRRIQEKAQEYEEAGRKGDPPLLKFLNKQYPLKAKVVKIDSFSAHADKNELIKFIEKSNLNIKKIAVVHGEESQSLSFAKDLENKGFEAKVPIAGETIDIN